MKKERKVFRLALHVNNFDNPKAAQTGLDARNREACDVTRTENVRERANVVVTTQMIPFQ